MGSVGGWLDPFLPDYFACIVYVNIRYTQHQHFIDCSCLFYCCANFPFLWFDFFFFLQIVVIFICHMNFFWLLLSSVKCIRTLDHKMQYFKWFDICRRCADDEWQVAYWVVGNFWSEKRKNVSYTNTHILNNLLYCCYYCRKVNFHPLVICYQSKFNRHGCIYFFFFFVFGTLRDRINWLCSLWPSNASRVSVLALAVYRKFNA